MDIMGKNRDNNIKPNTANARAVVVNVTTPPEVFHWYTSVTACPIEI